MYYVYISLFLVQVLMGGTSVVIYHPVALYLYVGCWAIILRELKSQTIFQIENIIANILVDNYI